MFVLVIFLGIYFKKMGLSASWKLNSSLSQTRLLQIATYGNFIELKIAIKKIHNGGHKREEKKLRYVIFLSLENINQMTFAF